MSILSKYVPTHVPQLTPFSALIACATLLAFIKLVRVSRRQIRTPKLRGPHSQSFAYGVGKILMKADDRASMYEAWAQEYGDVYQVPSTLGQRRLILYDPRAISHFSGKECWTYVRTPLGKKIIEHGFGRGLFWAEGESHRSIAAIRKLTPIFFDSAHKAKVAWNNFIESSGENSVIIDVQNWMNYISQVLLLTHFPPSPHLYPGSLDTIGLAGFSHDFGALDGKHASVTQIFDAFNSSSFTSAVNIGLDLLAQAFPSLMRMPTKRTRLIWKLNEAMEEISTTLFARTKRELMMGEASEKEEKSIIGLLIKGQNTESEFHLSKEEVLAQMKVLLLAGYETTSVSVTWALIELSRNPDVQTKLRNELLEYGSDPTYDQLANELPYLDAVVHEILRTHAPLREITRIADEDDVIPLSEPLRTASGGLVENVTISKGTLITVPFASINLSTAIWGEDAKEFKPTRWLEDDRGIPAKAKEIQGHRHLLTFSDGPRMCLGKNFAVAEFKAILSVLVRNFIFEFPEGPKTKIVMVRGILRRPRVEGEVGCRVPLRVRPYTE